MRRHTGVLSPANHPFITLFLLTLLSTTVSSTENTEVVEDLKDALVIKGIACDEATSTQRLGDKDYEISCSDGGRYRLNVTADGKLEILTIVAGIVRAGVKGIETVFKLPGRILGYGRESPEQLEKISRNLYTLVILSDQTCDEVTGIERRAVDDHVVSCRDGNSYRIHYAADGLVRVEPQ